MTKIELLRLYSDKIREGVMPGFDKQNAACVYHETLADGRKVQCAIGVLISDEVWGKYCDAGGRLYASFNDIGSAKQLFRECGFDGDKIVEGLTSYDLATIQSVHDGIVRDPDAKLENFRVNFFFILSHLACFKDVPQEIWVEVSRP